MQKIILKSHFYSSEKDEWLDVFHRDKVYDLDEKQSYIDLLIDAGRLLKKGHQVSIVMYRENREYMSEVDDTTLFETAKPAKRGRKSTKK